LVDILILNITTNDGVWFVSVGVVMFVEDGDVALKCVKNIPQIPCTAWIKLTRLSKSRCWYSNRCTFPSNDKKCQSESIIPELYKSIFCS